MGLISRGLATRGLVPAHWGMASDPSAIPSNGSLGRVGAGVVVNERTALMCSTVMSCVRVVAGDVSGLPIDAYRKVGRQRQWVDPVPKLLEDPFADQLAIDGWFGVVACLQLRGNAYLYVVDRDELGYPTTLLPLHPDSVRITRDRGVKGYTVNRVPVPAADIIHIRGFTLPGVDAGLAPIEYYAQGIGLALASEHYGAQYFAQGTVVSGVLTSDQVLAEDTVRSLVKRLAKSHGGLKNAHLPLILGAGLKWQSLTVPPEQAQFLQTRDFQKHDIAGFFGVPPERVGAVAKHASQGGGRGGDSRDLQYVKYTLRFWLLRIEAALKPHLPGGIHAKFNIDALLRADLQTRYASYSSARAGSWLTVNEIRELEDREPIPGGDDPFLPLNSAHADSSAPAGEPAPDDPEDSQ